jgi:replicative DNA helicase
MDDMTHTQVRDSSMPIESSSPATLSRIMEEEEQQEAQGAGSRLKAMPTGFIPLDDVLNGGIRPGDLAIISGGFGVGKTIMALQIAHNVIQSTEDAIALYVCFEHSRFHLLSRLLCLESSAQGYENQALTLRRLNELSLTVQGNKGIISLLRTMPRYAPLMSVIDKYASRLYLVKASGESTTLDQIRDWVQELWATGAHQVFLVVDYMQKIQIGRGFSELEADATTTFLAQGLKQMAMDTNTQVLAVVAADRTGLKSKRMRLTDLRGSSAIQYEADIGLVLNNKFNIVSREHLVYNITHAEEMRNSVVVSVEKNRAGINAVDLEFQLDAAHFRIEPRGDFVQDRLIDDKVVLA